MDKKFIHEELIRRGEKLTLAERMVKVEILLENHLVHHDKLTKYLLYPILVGVLISVVVSILTLIFKSGTMITVK